MADKTLRRTITILELVYSILQHIGTGILARRAHLRAIEQRGGDITEANWAQADADFNAAADAVLDALRPDPPEPTDGNDQSP